tara:strand:- start:1320 stop:1508 length:189 start_codon:yes stop_codon:yes gene_type:complete
MISDTKNITLNYSLIDVIDKIRENRFELSEAFEICDDEDTTIFADCQQPQEETVTCCCFGNI